MSYVTKKTRLFQEAGDTGVSRKRSDGRMKTYTSATDARAWCDVVEDRRQYILDLVRREDGKGLSLGKYIPIEAIIDILLANKNRDIKRLEAENEKLRGLLKEHGVRYEEEQVAVADSQETGAPETADGVPTRDIDESEGKSRKPRSLKADKGPESGSKVSFRSVSKSSSPSDLSKLGDEHRSLSVIAIKSRMGYGGETPTGEEQEVSDIRYFNEIPDQDSLMPTIADSEAEGRKAAQQYLAGKTPDEQFVALKQALADSEAFYGAEHELAVRAIEQLENIKDIVEGGQGNRHPSKAARSSFNKGAAMLRTAGETYADSCKDEIESLEREIAFLKSSSSPEAEIIRREVQVLRKYCAQLAAIQKENSDLKKERDMLASTADDGLKEKLARLDEVTRERDRLVTRVRQLEQELLNQSVSPQEYDLKEAAVTSLGGDEDHLRERFARLQGLEDEVRTLRDKAAKTLEAGDSREKDQLLTKISALEKEAERCKCDRKELEILRIERDCLKVRVDDLSKIQKDYEELLKKTQGFDALKAECAAYKSKYEELKNLEVECNALRARVERVEELENERRLLMKEIEDCECCMHNQEDEIKRLTCHIDCLTEDLDKRQDDMKVKVLTMRAHIEKKDILIANSEQKLADVQDQLRSSIELLSCETTCLRNRIDELEDEVAAYQKALAVKDEDYKSLERSLRAVEDSKRALVESNKSLLDSLQSEKNNTLRLEEALKVAIKSDDHLQQMLKQTKCAIKCITQKLEKHEFVGVGRFEGEREMYLKRIKEFSEGATEQPDLEEELLRANALNKSLKDQLERMTDLERENEQLRRLAGELQEAAKNQVNRLEDTTEFLSRKTVETKDKCEELQQELAEKQQMVADLQNQLSGLQRQLEDELNRNAAAEDNLKQQLEAERKRNTDLIANLENLSTHSDLDAAEINKLRAQINVLNAELDRVNFDLENQRRECAESVARLRAKVEEQEADAERIRKLRDENEDVGDSANRYRKECEALRAELDNRRRECDETVAKLRAKIEQQEADAERIRKLQDENADVSTDVDRYKKEGELLREELESLRNKMSDRDSEINKLKSELVSKSEIEKENNALKDELKKINIKKDGSEKEHGEEINKLKQELGTKDAVEKENKDLKDEINKLKQQLSSQDDAKKESSALRDELDKAKQNLIGKDALETENKSLKDEIDALKKEVSKGNALEKENKNLKDELDKLKKEMGDKSATKDDKMNTVENENKKLKDELDKLKKEMGDKSAVKDDKTNTLENENKNLKAELDDLKKELGKKSTVKDDSREKDFAVERDDLLKQIETQKKEIADLLNKIKEPIKSEDTTALKELENRNRENQQLRDTVDSLEKQLKDLQRVQMDVPKVSPEIDKVVNDLKSSLEKEEARARELEDSLKQCQESNEKLKKKNEELENSLRTSQGDDEGLKKKIAPLEGDRPMTQEVITAGDADQRVKALEDELAKHKKECNNMIASLKQQYDRDIKNLQKQNEAAINKLQKAQQEALKKLNRQHEDEMNKLKEELRKKELSLNKLKNAPKVQPKAEEVSVVEEDLPKEPSVKEPSAKEPSIKEPSMKEESQTSENVCICDKLPTVVPIGQVPQQEKRPSPQRPPSLPPSMISGYQPPTVAVPLAIPQFGSKREKITPLKKILELENKLLIKQECTKEKINMLQSTVENCKRELELERQKNTDLISRYKNQSQTVDHMKLAMEMVKRENFQDQRKLQQMKMAFQQMLDGVASVRAESRHTAMLTVQPVVPHFHTELTVVREESSAFKHNCVTKRKTCPCREMNSDFEIDE